MEFAPEIQRRLTEKLKSNGSQIASAVTVLSALSDVVTQVVRQRLTLQEKQKLALSTLEKIAAGSDGLLGTADDLIPDNVLNQIRSVLQNQLAADLLAVFLEHAKSGFSLLGCCAKRS